MVRVRQLGGGTVVAFEPAHDSAVKLRVAAARNRLDRAGVDGTEIRELLRQLGYQSTGQVLPVANDLPPSPDRAGLTRHGRGGLGWWSG